ncbi:MAG: endonuclease/exonuclease/phosphatase family protein [Phycisphaeraceae bacterium]|nr:endonuclease/exonuclease/phosphatase family protein [Phycisphaeraceae bacterium]
MATAPDESPAPPPRLARHTRVLAVLAWAGVAMACLAMSLALLWRTDLENTQPLHVMISWAAFLALTFHFHLALVAGAALLLALATKRRRLALASAAVVAAGLVPAAWSCRPKPAPVLDGGDHLTIMSANLLFSRAEPSRLKALVDAERPDVIVLQEYTLDGADAIRRVLSGDYPHMIEQPQENAYGQAVFSKRSFTQPPRLYPEGAVWDCPQILSVVEVGGRRVGIMDIHLYPPGSYNNVVGHRLQAATLARHIRAVLASGTLDGLVLAGDFNATPESPHLGAIRGAGLAAAHDQAGIGRGATWPNVTMARFAPGIRIDQILLSDSLACTDSRVLDRIGSDHRPIVARVGWRRAGGK